MSSAIPLELPTPQARIAEAREKIAGLEKKQRAVDSELQGMSEQCQQYQLLEQVCSSLTKLDEMGAAALFWGEHTQAAASYVKRASSALLLFSEKLAAVEQRRKALQDRIQDELAIIAELTYELDEQQREQEELENEFIVHREVGQRPYRPVVMPWHAQAEDDRRFRRALSVALLAVLMLGIATSMWIFPEQPVQEVVEIPKQVVMLAQQARPKPPPPPPPAEEKLREKASEKKGDTSNPKTGETKDARAKAEGTGVLAFKSGFSDLLQDSPSLKLGADAHVTANGQKAAGNGGRSLVVAQAREGSAGINTSALSYGIAGGGGGGGGGRIGGVQFTRVESSIGGGGVPGGGGGGALGDGPGPARTDEEIQIVFDRYKAALYRIYNRELRTDPTLRGKMVLRITIEPNGEVSACTVASSDLASDVLKKEVVERVLRFNFGPKDNVSRITILYPIDFLPAS